MSVPFGLREKRYDEPDKNLEPGPVSLGRGFRCRSRGHCHRSDAAEILGRRYDRFFAGTRDEGKAAHGSGAIAASQPYRSK